MAVDPFDILSTERGVVRVFTSALEPEGSAAIRPENVHKLLGDGLELDPSRIEVFPSKAVEAIGLSGYLHDGYGVPKEDLQGTSAALDSLTGLVILISSGAFQGKAVTLDPKPALRFVGVYQEPRAAPPTNMAVPETADGVLEPAAGPTPPFDTRRGSTWPIVLLALLAAAALVLFLVL